MKRLLQVVAKLRLAALLGAVVALALAGARTAGAAEPVAFGILPYLPAAELNARFAPLARVLGEAIGRPVRISVAPDYETLIGRVGRDEIELAYIGPAPYVGVVERFGPKAILGRLEVAGRPTFQGAIVVRADSPVNGLAELAGKRFAFGDAGSTMSHLVPRYMLRQAGVEVEDLAGYAFLGSHKNVAVAVLLGEFDAGAVKDEVLAEHAPALRALALSPPISEQFFVATAKLPAEDVERVRSALMDLNSSPEKLAVLGGITAGVTGLVPASDEDYDGLRKILRALDAHGG